jgi:2-polyprenyl-3-methyl-5-hydroxy-6-metoxy-1,4-benzoquinol methylase
MKNNPKCLACKSENIELIFDYTDTKVVTSDNKTDTCNFSLSICKECSLIQKDITQKLVKTIDDIYTNYESYYLTDGKEEISFDGNQQASTRSINIVNNIEDFIKVDGNILDVGAGKGVFLKEFSKRYDRWNLYSQDIKDNLDKSIKKLPNFQKSFFLEGDNLPQKHFDIISTIHVFEHIFDIDSFIKKVKSSLKSDGLLLIQVPYLKENIFDVFIIDHLMHFMYDSLNNVLKRYFEFIYYPKKQLNKEITLIVSDRRLENKELYCYDEKHDMDLEISLKKIVEYLKSLDSEVAVFGTSPPALFCANYLGFEIDCFLDENKDKISKKFYDQKIVLPSEFKKNIKVIFPYSKEMFYTISKKYPHIDFIYLGTIV